MGSASVSPSVCHPSTFRMMIWPDAIKAQNSIAAVSADGSTVWVLMRRLTPSLSRPPSVNSSCSPEQGGDRAQQAFGLLPHTAEGQAQQVAGLDCHVRVVAGAATLTGSRRMPGRERLDVIQTAKLPRCCSITSYSGQLAASQRAHAIPRHPASLAL